MTEPARMPNTMLKAGRWLMYATLLVPIVLVPGLFFPFVAGRGLFFRTVVELAFALAAMLLLTREYKKSGTRDYLLIAVAGFVAANALSAIFGLSPMRSFFGGFERMWGVWTYVHLMAYYILLRVFLNDNDNDNGWIKFFRVALIICAITCVYGLFQYYQDILGIPWESSGGAPVYSTIGNSGLYAGYLLFNIAFAVYLWFEDINSKWRFAYLPLAALITFTLFLAANRSTLLGAILGIVAAATCYAAIKARRKWVPPVLALIVGLIILTPALVVRLNPDPEFRKSFPTVFQRIAGIGASSSNDAIRLYQWRAAAKGFAAKPVLGYGPENYHLVWSAQFDPGSYQFGAEERWDRAHNAYLEVMSTNGLVGTVALLAMLGAFIYVLFGAHRRGAISAGGFSVILGLFVAYGFYLIFWFFDLNSTMLLFAVGAHLASRNDPEPWIRFGEKIQLAPARKITVGAGVLLLVAVLYVHSYEPMRVAHRLHRIMVPGRNPQEYLNDFKYIFNSPSPQANGYLGLYSSFLAQIKPSYDLRQRNTSYAKYMDDLFVLAFSETGKEVREDSLNERVHIQKGRIALMAASVYKNPELYQVAIKSLEHAIDLNPRRINTHLILANIYLATDDYDRAYASMANAYDIYPKFGQTHNQFAQLEIMRNNFKEAGRWMLSAIRLKYVPPAAMVLKVGKAIGEEDKAAERTLYNEYIWLVYPDFKERGILQTRGPAPPEIQEMMRRSGRVLDEI